MGPIERVMAEVETVHKTRPGGQVTNDDHAQIMCRLKWRDGAHLFQSRRHGAQMGYAYEIHGTKGSIRFDQEDQTRSGSIAPKDQRQSAGFAKS